MKCYYNTRLHCPYTRIEDNMVDDVPCYRCSLHPSSSPVKWYIMAGIIILVVIIGFLLAGIWLFLIANNIEDDKLDTRHIEWGN